MSDINPTDEEYEARKKFKGTVIMITFTLVVTILVAGIFFDICKCANEANNDDQTNVVQVVATLPVPIIAHPEVKTWLTRIIYEAPGGVIKTNDVYEGEEACWTIGSRLMITHGKNNVEYIVSPRIHVIDHDPH